MVLVEDLSRGTFVLQGKIHETLLRNLSVKTFSILFLAILSEVIATTALKFSEGFSKLVPSVVVVLGYGFSFYMLSVALKVMPIGVAYAIWSGVGLILTVIVGMILWQERQ